MVNRRRNECLEPRALGPHLRAPSLVTQGSRTTEGARNLRLSRATTDFNIRRTAFRQAMRHPDELHAFEHGFDTANTYSPQLAQEALYQLKRLRRERKVPEVRPRRLLLQRVVPTLLQ